jgi:hypothetical protein
MLGNGAAISFNFDQFGDEIQPNETLVLLVIKTNTIIRLATRPCTMALRVVAWASPLPFRSQRLSWAAVSPPKAPSRQADGANRRPMGHPKEYLPAVARRVRRCDSPAAIAGVIL